MMNTWKIIWHWIDKDGYLCGQIIFSSDNVEDVLKEWRQRAGLTPYGWYDIVKGEE